jgi:hypothetical protein
MIITASLPRATKRSNSDDATSLQIESHRVGAGFASPRSHASSVPDRIHLCPMKLQGVFLLNRLASITLLPQPKKQKQTTSSLKTTPQSHPQERPSPCHLHQHTIGNVATRQPLQHDQGRSILSYHGMPYVFRNITSKWVKLRVS